MRIVWISDIHLDHLGRYFINSRKPEITKLVDQIKGLGPDIVMCTGDLTNANLLVEDIEQLISDLDPVKFLFVLGNHDCWGSGWIEIQQLMSTNFPNNWLSSLGSVKLTEEICLVGQDGWYDGLLGKPFVSNIQMNDWHNISDFSSCKDGDGDGEIDVGQVLNLIKSKAEEETVKLKQVIEKNITSYTTFMIATHIPPFAENALDYPYGKKKPSTKPEKSSVYSLPWYTNKTMGDMLTNLAEQYPDKMFNVFCGHAHADCTVKHRDNLICSTAYSVYGKPEKSIKVIELAT